KLTASMIDGADYLAARAAKRRDEHNPSGPIVAFSGGMEWHDHEQLFERLDQIKRRIPSMVLMTTAMNKGADAIAASWAASREVKLVRMFLDKRHGNRGGFLRNDRIASLRPVEAIVCEGSGVQIDFARKLRTAGVPLHVFRKDGQAPVQPSQRSRRA
ncbi:SLOG family protein, partial [Staphylococcus aureus]|nr:SLOG family protein [Staphylococcus aureus]